MKANWTVTVVLVGAIVVAGLFAQGMTRVSGLAPTQAQLNAPVARQPSLMPVRNAPPLPEAATASAAPAAAHVAGAEEKPAPRREDGAEVSSLARPAEGDTHADSSPPHGHAGATTPAAAVAAPGETTPPVASPAAMATAAIAPPAASASPTSAAPKRPAPPRLDRPDEAGAASPALTAAQRRQAQCRALAGWLQQLDTIAAERRGDTGYLEWTRAQREQARERQAELGCNRAPA